MTIEDYNAATDILAKMQRLDDSIYDIKNIIQTGDVAKWNMAVRPNDTYPYKKIDHEGLLLEFLNMVLSNLHKEREELKKKLEQI